MAPSGFPWHVRSHVSEPAYLNEKKAAEAADLNKASQQPLSDVTNKRPMSPQAYGKKRSLSQGRRRQGSLRVQVSEKPTINVMPNTTPLRERPDRLPVRTIPPWVRDAEEDDLNTADVMLPDSPHAAYVAQHNHMPSAAERPLLSADHRKAEGYPMSSGERRSERTSRWISFARTSAYPRETYAGEQVDPEWLDKNFTDYSKPWLADHNDDEVEDGSSRYRAFRKKRQAWYKRSQVTILRNPFIPLVFRMIVISFALTAIGLGASIYTEIEKIVHCIQQDPRGEYCQSLVGTGPKDYSQDPSALMAIIVDAIAVVYTMYITYDEYFSKPLGLRSARAKVRLVLLDLFFIVFQAANLGLSFESLTVGAGACQVGDEPRTATKFDRVCDRAQALSSVLFISLVAWLMTFSVSVFRLVERIDTR